VRARSFINNTSRRPEVPAYPDGCVTREIFRQRLAKGHEDVEVFQDTCTLPETLPEASFIGADDPPIQRRHGSTASERLQLRKLVALLGGR
jgi:hypothetical protein